MKIDKIAVTEGRLNQAMENALSPFFQKQSKTIQKQIAESQLQLGVITKYYPYLDKAEVELSNPKKRVICKLPHIFMGDLIDFFTPSGTETYCTTMNEPCVVPLQNLQVAVMQIKEDNEYFILSYFTPEDIVGVVPASEGNMRLSYISPTNEQYIEFGKNGLNIVSNKRITQKYGEFEDDLTEVETYTKEEVDEKLKAITDDAIGKISYQELLKLTEEYKQTSEDKYTLFRGDLWTINNNFESSASITSQPTHDGNGKRIATNNFKVTGTFRTINDLVGIYWNSEDPIQHPYISYGKISDYSGVILDFDYQMSGCKNFNDNIISITIGKNSGAVYYLSMNRFIHGNHVTLDFDNLTLLPGNEYINSKGQTIRIEEETPLKVTDIKYIMFVLVPTNYVENNSRYTIMANADFTCTISNIRVSNGEICNEHIPLKSHGYRICEGYDDFYDINPFRICKEMRKLGYTEWCDLYIGASHFYEKSGTAGDVITDLTFNHNRTEKMVLNKNVPLNKAFRAWLDCYSRELKVNGCPNLVVSVSMENLQCPTSWRQRRSNGDYALTGWVPSTFFYSPCHAEVAPYMQAVSQACLDIVVANGLQPILQMGEAWWWWQESATGRPPCFYDDATKEKYYAENGLHLPIYESSEDKFDESVIYWLNSQLVNYSDKLREVVKSSRYTNGLYMALFFPPSVTDTDRVPPMMRQANYLRDAYHPAKLDVLQLEDYDWVIEDSPHHYEVYDIGQELGFPEDRIHYFGGFVQYKKDAIKYWRLIKTSMEDAVARGFKEVYVWAGSQVRRDNKILGYEKYELVQQLLNKE